MHMRYRSFRCALLFPYLKNSSRFVKPIVVMQTLLSCLCQPWNNWFTLNTVSPSTTFTVAAIIYIYWVTVGCRLGLSACSITCLMLIYFKIIPMWSCNVWMMSQLFDWKKLVLFQARTANIWWFTHWNMRFVACFWFDIVVNWILVGNELLIDQNKTLNYFTLCFRIFWWAFFSFSGVLSTSNYSTCT